MSKQHKLTKAEIEAEDETLRAAEAEADGYGVVWVSAPKMPERFSTGGATADEIAAWKAANGG
jgi:hypothetical protein